MDRLVDRLMYWLVNWLVDLLVDLLMDRLVLQHDRHCLHCPELRGLGQVAAGLGHAGHDGLPHDVDLATAGQARLVVAGRDLDLGLVRMSHVAVLGGRQLGGVGGPGRQIGLVGRQTWVAVGLEDTLGGHSEGG